MPEVLEPTSWGAGATAAPNDMVVIVDRDLIFLSSPFKFQGERRRRSKSKLHKLKFYISIGTTNNSS